MDMKNLKPGQVIVETRDYENNHGAKPRGEGNWLFCTVRPGSPGYLDKVIPAGRVVEPHLRTYGEQKKAAQRWAAANEIPVIYVCD
jgi:hypothetical protein